MNNWTSAFITANDTKLHYYRTGGEKTPLILIHGITDDGLCWTPIAESLSADYDVIMLDLRGHGKSDAPDDGYDFKTIAGDLAALVNKLGLEKPIIMGHSLGAMTTLSVAAYHPDLPSAIVLEDPPPFWGTKIPSDDDLAHRAGMEAWFYDLKRKTHVDLLNDVRSENPNWQEAEFAPWVDSKHRFSLKIVNMIDPQETVPSDFRSKLGGIYCPTLLLTANQTRGSILKPEDVSDLVQLIPQTKVIHFPNAGHNIRRDQFSSYMDVVNAFLKEV